MPEILRIFRDGLRYRGDFRSWPVHEISASCSRGAEGAYRNLLLQMIATRYPLRPAGLIEVVVPRGIHPGKENPGKADS